MLPCVIIGLPGVGKSHLANMLATTLKVVHWDSDSEMCAQMACPDISSVWQCMGAAKFRLLEERLILARPSAPEVWSLGGGAIESLAVQARLRQLPVVKLYSENDHNALFLRRGARPLSLTGDDWQSRIAARAEIMRSIDGLSVAAEPPEQALLQCINWLESLWQVTVLEKP